MTHDQIIFVALSVLGWMFIIGIILNLMSFSKERK